MRGRGRALRLAIRVYQLTFSAFLGRECRYLPTCSDYAAEAVERHGSWAGAWMAAARLCRCHPLGPWGYDPVPIRCDPAPRWRPWAYGIWRMRVAGQSDQERARSSAAKP